jgi:hypothetical protein
MEDLAVIATTRDVAAGEELAMVYHTKWGRAYPGDSMLVRTVLNAKLVTFV